MFSLKTIKKLVIGINLLLIGMIIICFISFASAKQKSSFNFKKYISRHSGNISKIKKTSMDNIMDFANIYELSMGRTKTNYLTKTSSYNKKSSGTVDVNKILKLVGTIVDNDPNSSVAIFEKKRDQIYVHCGENPLEKEGIDSKVKEIGFDSIILIVNGDEVEILMNYLSEMGSKTSPKKNTPRPIGTSRKKRKTNTRKKPSIKKPSSPSGTSMSSSEAIRQFSSTHRDPSIPNSWVVDEKEKDWLLKNADLLAKEVTPTPVFTSNDGDTINGIKLSKIQKGSILEKRGFREGDVIKEINGRAVTSLKQAQQMQNDPSIKNANEIIVKVERLGRIVKLRYRSD